MCICACVRLYIIGFRVAGADRCGLCAGAEPAVSKGIESDSEIKTVDEIGDTHARRFFTVKQYVRELWDFAHTDTRAHCRSHWSALLTQCH